MCALSSCKLVAYRARGVLTSCYPSSSTASALIRGRDSRQCSRPRRIFTRVTARVNLRDKLAAVIETRAAEMPSTLSALTEHVRLLTLNTATFAKKRSDLMRRLAPDIDR